jgi:transcriptional regulator with XRE-family HTH domain
MEEITVKQMLEQISDRIRTQRKLLGVTQEQLAEYADLSTTHIARIELGNKTPSVRTLLQIAKALNINPADLVSEEPPVALSYTEQVAHALSGLTDTQSRFVVDQLCATSDFLKRQCKE